MIILVLLSFLGAAHAAPKELEVWFLTASKSAELERRLFPGPVRGVRVAQACEQVGDYCFDPQVGLYKPTAAPPDRPENEFVPEELPQLPSAKSVDRSLVSCDPKYAFDLFCGKAVPEPSKGVPTPALEVWIDTSSSMREMDWADAQGHCRREAFLKKLDEACGFQRKVSVMMYDTSKREMGSMSSACQNVGMNDAKRLMEWIENSEAKKLVVVTDVHELQKEFADFLAAHGARLRGDKGSFTGQDMVAAADALASSCR